MSIRRVRTLSTTGTDWEKQEVKDKNGNYSVVSESVTEKFTVVTTRTEKDYKKNEETHTININIGLSTGLGLVLNFELNIPIYKTVQKLK